MKAVVRWFDASVEDIYFWAFVRARKSRFARVVWRFLFWLTDARKASRRKNYDLAKNYRKHALRVLLPWNWERIPAVKPGEATR